LQIAFYIAVLFATSHMLLRHYLGRLIFALIILPAMLGLIVRNYVFEPNFALFEQFAVASLFLMAGYNLMMCMHMFAPKKKQNYSKKKALKYKPILWIVVLLMFYKVYIAFQQNGIGEVKIALTRNNGFIFLFQIACLKLLIAEQLYKHKSTIVVIMGLAMGATGSRFQSLLIFLTQIFWNYYKTHVKIRYIFYLGFTLLFLILFSKIRDGGDIQFVLYWLIMRFDFFYNTLKLTVGHVNSDIFYTYTEHLLRVFGLSLPNDIGLINRYFHSMFTQLGSKSSGYAFGEYLVFNTNIIPFLIGVIAFNFHKFLDNVFRREDITSLYYFLIFINVVNFHYEGFTGSIFQALVLNLIYSVALIRICVR